MQDEYRTVARAGVHETEVNRSRFLCALAPAATEQEAQHFIAAVVPRSYGGVKLGAGGLIRAYGGAVGEALDSLGTLPRRRFRLATVTVDHQRAGKVQNDLRSTGREVRDVRYGEDVTIEIGLPDADVDAFRAWLADATAGTAGF